MRGRHRPSSLVALCVAAACVGLSRAPSVGAVNPGIAGVLSASGVNYVLNSLIPVIERERIILFYDLCNSMGRLQ
jgi:hypothetical protein